MYEGDKQFTRRGVLKNGVLATGALLIGGTGTAAAKTIDVPSDYSTIQGAVDAASPGDTIVVESGTYTEQVVVRKDLTVKADGDVTLLAPSGNLSVSGFPLVQPIFGAVGDDITVNFDGFTVDGEEQTDKSSRWYTGIGYFKSDGEIRDVEVTGTTGSGIFVTQNRGGGGDQNVDVLNSHFENIGDDNPYTVDAHVTHNEPGTTGTVKGCEFVGDQGDTPYLYGGSPGYGASVTYQNNTFDDFYGGSYQVGFYGFNTPDCTVHKNQFQTCQLPIYVAATNRVSLTGGDKCRIVQNDIDGEDLPDDLNSDSFGTTLFAEDLDTNDGTVQTVNNAKIVNNDYSNLDVGVSLNATGEGVVNNTKIIRNEFKNVGTEIENNGGEQTKQEANRI